MTKLARSPLAPKNFPNLLPVAGVEMGVAESRMKYAGRPDTLLATFAAGTVAAGVFTKNTCPAAPVDWCRAALTATGGSARALVVNAGNANAFTGQAGADATRITAETAAALIGADPQDVMICSTGVIGEVPPIAPLTQPLAGIHNSLSGSQWLDAATAISTTDTFPKGCSKVATIDGEKVVLSGITKGSGMIQPNMATMLAFVFTNANVSQGVLQALLSDVTEKSFNAVTVDSDTSTNDTLLAFATGVNAGHEQITDPADPRLADFTEKFTELCIDLAQQLVRDGEGATKFVTIKVQGGADDASAKRTALAIANSPLMKTAIAGEDPNWGRLVMAIGKSGEQVNRDAVKIWIGDQPTASSGVVLASYSEDEATKHMQGSEVSFTVDVGVASGEATVWTCDLTHGYITINADYRS